ncbi:cell division FtsZ family protein [Desulfovibrio sp. OttesenSCG-928-G11]|nr:cell division FtsZ family protein [Desulfovibrio sp. OttesenSCG-928-G11]
MELSGPAKIKVVGVGGGGGNALNEMIRQRLHGVEFIAVNTDNNSLQYSLADQKIQIGERLTKGMGAGGNPRKGRQAALEDIEKLKDAVSGADMVVIVAGMGGGTGTGAAPVIAQVAKEIGVLTVGVVSLPFSFEGKSRFQKAKTGIDNMLTHSNSVVVISCDECVQDPAGKKTFLTMLMEADTALCSAVRGITDLITPEGLLGIDFADVNAILRSQGGLCLMAEGKGAGGLRAHDAAVAAIAAGLEVVDDDGGMENVSPRNTGWRDYEESDFIFDEEDDPCPA